MYVHNTRSRYINDFDRKNMFCRQTMQKQPRLGIKCICCAHTLLTYVGLNNF